MNSIRLDSLFPTEVINDCLSRLNATVLFKCKNCNREENLTYSLTDIKKIYVKCKNCGKYYVLNKNFSNEMKEIFSPVDKKIVFNHLIGMYDKDFEPDEGTPYHKMYVLIQEAIRPILIEL